MRQAWSAAGLAVIVVLIVVYLLYSAYTNHQVTNELHQHTDELLNLLRAICADLHLSCPASP